VAIFGAVLLWVHSGSGGLPFGALEGLAAPPEVTAPTERRVTGVRTRRSRRMDPRGATTWRGIPVTTLPRTLVDLADSYRYHHSRHAWEQDRRRER
jgi:hypothetical protein